MQTFTVYVCTYTQDELNRMTTSNIKQVTSRFHCARICSHIFWKH